MTEIRLKDVEHGLYLIFWKEGGTSLASVGSNQKGERWFAPTNWIKVPSYDWKSVAAVEKIPVYRIHRSEQR